MYTGLTAPPNHEISYYWCGKELNNHIVNYLIWAMNPIKDIDLYAVGGQFVAYRLLRLSTTTAFSQKKKKKKESTTTATIIVSHHCKNTN